MYVLSRGKCGDIIALCAWARHRYSKTGDKVHIYARQHKPFRKGQLQFIEPLLRMQPYVADVGWISTITDKQPHIPELNSPDVNQARNLARQYNYYSGWWVDEQSWWKQINRQHKQTDLRYRFPYAYDEEMPQVMEPWLVTPDDDPVMKQPYIVISIVPRYGCCRNFQAIRDLAATHKILFIGHKHDYDAFGQRYGEYYQVKDIMDAVNLIKHSSLYAGTQTLYTWLAQSIGADRILSVSDKFHDTTFRVSKGFKGAFVYPAQLKLMLSSWESFHGRIPKVGYIIGTYGSPAYVQLQLAMHKKWGHHVVVSDDGSHDNRLKELGEKYNVKVLGVDDRRMGHQRGDHLVYVRMFGDEMADCDWVVKLSRRFLWLKDFQDTILQHDRLCWKPCLSAWWLPYKQLQGHAVTTSCIAFNRSGMPEPVLRDFSSYIPKGGAYMQRLVTSWLQKFYGNIPFTRWDAIYKEQGRCITCDDILWRQKNTPEDYYKVSRELGLKWTLKDFQDIVTE